MEAEFAWESLSVIFREPNWRSLIADQWVELSHLPDVEPEFDFAAMYELEKAGHYRTWVARKEGLMIGFIQWMFHKPFAYRGQLWALDCGHYIDCEHRDVHTAIAMWRGAEAALRAIGVTAIRAHDNEKRPLDPFFKRLGYEKVSSMYQRML